MTITDPLESSKTLYDQDFYQWLIVTADLLRTKQFHAVDLENLIEEIEDLGKSQKHALESNLEVVLLHLLKWIYQPDRRSNSWKSSIFEHRKRLRRQLRDSPSLKNYLLEMFDECYAQARKGASFETAIPVVDFPEQSPFTPEQVLDEAYFPN